MFGFGKKRVKEMTTINISLKEYLALRKVADAASGFMSEADNPVPDLALKAHYRNRLQASLKELEKFKQKG